MALSRVHYESTGRHLNATSKPSRKTHFVYPCRWVREVGFGCRLPAKVNCFSALSTVECPNFKGRLRGGLGLFLNLCRFRHPALPRRLGAPRGLERGFSCVDVRPSMAVWWLPWCSATPRLDFAEASPGLLAMFRDLCGFRPSRGGLAGRTDGRTRCTASRTGGRPYAHCALRGLRHRPPSGSGFGSQALRRMPLGVASRPSWPTRRSP